MPEVFGDIMLQASADGVGIPDRAAEQVLHTAGTVVAGVFGQLPTVLAFDGAEQPLQVG